MGDAPRLISLQGRDGYRFASRVWAPRDGASACVLIVHGIQSHGGWFEGSGEFLAARGLGVLMPDRRGSGLNERLRGHAARPGRLIGDLIACMDYARDNWGAERIHIVGISWGGKLAACLARRCPQRVSGVTFVTPGIFAKVDLSLRAKAAVAASCIFQPRRLFPIPLDDPRLFTANPERIRFIESDRLRLRAVTASFLRVSKQLDFASCRPLPPSVPAHLMLAEHDDIVDNDRLQHWLRRQPGPNRRTTIYDGARHTLEFEPDPSAYWDDLLEGILGVGR